MTPLQVLNKYWGYDSFRPLQTEIIDNVLAGHDTLGLMPTGGGKSLTFQIPALILPGLTIVITPLISLMKDQVDNLKDRGVKAAALYTGMTRRERTVTFDKARLGKIKLLYVSPERLGSENFRAELHSWDVSLIVVDEAHCISQWGYDFRPSYLRIAELRKFFPDAPILALTASATPMVQKDIQNNLSFRSGSRRFAQSFHRDNLSYVVRYGAEKEGRLIDALNAVPGTAIVYVRSRKATARYAEVLCKAGINATFYHAGLDPVVKEQRQQQWKEGEVRVMVATNAFGMGIDKADVRVVVHLDVPPSLEEYYQEAGRAGRDGRKSYALMLASNSDKAMLTRRLNAAYPPRDYILNVYDKACVFMDIPVGEGFGHVYEFDIAKFCKTFRFDPDSVHGALTILTNAGYFDYNDDPMSRAGVQIIIRRDEFYGLRLLADEQEVINAILRLYPGLFADYVGVDEESIAAVTSLGREQVYQALLALSRKKIIDYVPKRLLPYIYMTTARELPKHIVIPRSIYEDRRALMEQRIEAIRQFVFSTENCRDTVLLQYFGEPNPGFCGMCDVCVQRRKSEQLATRTDEQIQKDSDALTRHILNCVMQCPGLDMDRILNTSPSLKDPLLERLRALINQGTLVRQGNALFLSLQPPESTNSPRIKPTN